MRILMVCLGNICRSPMAKAIALERCRLAGFAWDVDSAGTGAWHIGNGADPRTISECRRRGTPLTHTARQVQAGDFEEFDLILAMDHRNLADLESLRPPQGAWPILLGSFDPVRPDAVIADPYHDGPEAFAACYDHLARCIDGLITAAGRDGTRLLPPR